MYDFLPSDELVDINKQIREISRILNNGFSSDNWRSRPGYITQLNILKEKRFALEERDRTQYDIDTGQAVQDTTKVFTPVTRAEEDKAKQEWEENPIMGLEL